MKESGGFPCICYFIAHPCASRSACDRASARALCALIHVARWLWRIFIHRRHSSNITLTVLESQGWVHPTEMALAKQFETQTGIHIDYQIIPSANYFQVLDTKLNSGQGPDIFGGQSGVSDLEVNYNVTAECRRSVEPSVGEAGRSGRACPGDPQRQGVWPGDLGHLQRLLGHRLQQGPSSRRPGSPASRRRTTDFVADCAKIKAAGVNPIYEPISDGWHQVLWYPEIGARMEQLEPGLYDKLNANQATLAGDSASNTAMTQINELYQKGYFGSTALSDQYANTEKEMASGKYAMTIDSLTEPTAIKAAYPSVQASSFGFFPIPILDNQLLPTHPAGPTKFVYAKGSHIAQAEQYLDFLAEPANLQYYVDHDTLSETVDFTGVKAKWTPEQQAFLNQYQAATTLVLQDGVKYVNPQWIEHRQGHGRHVHAPGDAPPGVGEHRHAADAGGAGRPGPGLAVVTIA